MTNPNPLRHCLPLLAGLFMLTACSNKDANPDHTEANSSTGSGKQNKENPPAAAFASSLPQADASRPLSSYPEITGQAQLNLLYTATSKLPPDYEKLAGALSEEYRSSNDAFRKNDLMQVLKPRIDQGIAEVATAPYGWLAINDVQLQPYDFQRKGFEVDEFSANRKRHFTYGGNAITWSNWSQLTFMPVADEALARKLESTRQKWREAPSLKIFFFAQSVDMNKGLTNAYVTRVQVVDRAGQVLVEYSPDGSKPVTAPVQEDCGNPADCAAAAF